MVLYTCHIAAIPDTLLLCMPACTVCCCCLNQAWRLQVTALLQGSMLFVAEVWDYSRVGLHSIHHGLKLQYSCSMQASASSSTAVPQHTGLTMLLPVSAFATVLPQDTNVGMVMIVDFVSCQQSWVDYSKRHSRHLSFISKWCKTWCSNSICAPGDFTGHAWHRSDSHSHWHSSTLVCCCVSFEKLFSACHMTWWHSCLDQWHVWCFGTKRLMPCTLKPECACKLQLDRSWHHEFFHHCQGLVMIDILYQDCWSAVCQLVYAGCNHWWNLACTSSALPVVTWCPIV